jgi:epoxide hydrolase-like predicted phosphatase
MTIHAVLFDIGGVLFRMGDFSRWREWEKRLGLANRQLGEIVFENPVSYQAFRGEATAAEAWNEAAKRLGLTPRELRELKADFWRGGFWDPELLALVRSLKPHYKTGVISDAWDETRVAIQDYVNPDVFDVIVISAEEGLVKPDPEIFRRALSRLGVSPHQAIFVDDRRKNVRGAQQVGLRAVLFTNTQRVIEEVERLVRKGRKLP